MLCVRSDRPVDGLTIAVLRAVAPLARKLRIPYFIVGAIARDILLTHVHGIETGLGTRDVDFAVAVRNWPQFEEMKARLVAMGRFKPAEQAHRLLYHARTGTHGYPLDIIPFRGAEQPGKLVAWPPAMAERMNVVGYEEALATAVQVEIEPDLLVTVASLPGLTLLKLFAWDDRGHANPKDARDLVTLMRTYARVVEDRLYGDQFELLNSVGHDVDRAGVRLLGCDVRDIALPGTLEKLRQLLDDTRRAERLVVNMTAGLAHHENNADLAEQLLAEFRIGLLGS